jgi:hypothetical protein
MTADLFIVKPGEKHIVLVRTESRRFFKISNRKIKNSGLVPKAVEVQPQYMTELYARFGVQSKAKRRASRIKRLRKEEASI